MRRERSEMKQKGKKDTHVESRIKKMDTFSLLPMKTTSQHFFEEQGCKRVIILLMRLKKAMFFG